MDGRWSIRRIGRSIWRMSCNDNTNNIILPGQCRDTGDVHDYDERRQQQTGEGKTIQGWRGLKITSWVICRRQEHRWWRTVARVVLARRRLLVNTVSHALLRVPWAAICIQQAGWVINSKSRFLHVAKNSEWQRKELTGYARMDNLWRKKMHEENECEIKEWLPMECVVPLTVYWMDANKIKS